jgi:hypothetical protein
VLDGLSKKAAISAPGGDETSYTAFITMAQQKWIPVVSSVRAVYSVAKSDITRGRMVDSLTKWYRSFVFQRYYGRYISVVVQHVSNRKKFDSLRVDMP